MSQYAQEGGRGAQNVTFGYNNNHSQHPNQTAFSLSDQQYLDQVAAGGGILSQNDNNLMNSFFVDPTNTANQMSFNFDPMAGGEGEDSKFALDGLFDLDRPRGQVQDPGAAFGAQPLHYDADDQVPSHSTSNSQRQSMSNQMDGAYDNEHSSDAAEEDTKAAVEGLIGMSTNRPAPGETVLENGNGISGGAWGAFSFNSPWQSANGQSAVAGAQSMGNPAHLMQGPFGYISPMPQYQVQPGTPMGMGLHAPSHAFGQQHARAQSLANIHGNEFTPLPSGEPRSAHLPNSNYPAFHNNQTRPPLYTASFGSDDNFSTGGYRPENSYTPVDEKAQNLTNVPLADEASAHARSSRQPPRLPPNFQPRAPGRQSQGFHSSSQPGTPLYSQPNNQRFLGGLPNTSNSNMAATFAPQANAAGLGQSNAYYPGNMHMNTAAAMKRKARPGEESEGDSSEQEGSDLGSPAKQPVRKQRRKSAYDAENEEEYQPPSAKRRSQQKAGNDSSDEEEYEQSTASKGSKRPQPISVRRNSNNGFTKTNSPPARAPRPAPTPASNKRGSMSRSQRDSAVAAINRAPLTDEQRRVNHIKSEKSRRDLIKTNYIELNNTIPALKNGKSGLSKSEVLREIVHYIEELEEGNRQMAIKIQGMREKKRSDELAAQQAKRLQELAAQQGLHTPQESLA